MHLSTALESHTLDLKHETLECMSAAVASTPLTSLWDDIAHCFVVHAQTVRQQPAPQPQDDDPFDAVDPVPTIKPPLCHDVMKPPPSYKDPITKAIEALTLTTGQSLLTDPNSTESILQAEAKSQARQLWETTLKILDLVTIDQAVGFIPLTAKTLSIVGVPAHLICKQTGKIFTPCISLPVHLQLSILWPAQAHCTEGCCSHSPLLCPSRACSCLSLLSQGEVVDPHKLGQPYEGPSQHTELVPLRGGSGYS